MLDSGACEVLAYFLSDTFAEPDCPRVPNYRDRSAKAEEVLEALQCYQGPNEKIQFFASFHIDLFRRIFIEWQILKSWRD